MAAPALVEKPLQLDPKYDDYDFPIAAPKPLAGHPGYTTPEQDAQVFQLRSKLEAAGITDQLDTLTLVLPLHPLFCYMLLTTCPSYGSSAHANSMSLSQKLCMCYIKI